MRYVILMFATALTALWLVIWLLWKHTLPVMIVGSVFFGFLYLLATVRKRGRYLQVLQPQRLRPLPFSYLPDDKPALATRAEPAPDLVARRSKSPAPVTPGEAA